MTDITQGQDAPNDNALFNEAVSTTTLHDFENPVLPKVEEPPAPKPEDPKPEPQPKPDDNAPVPPGRLREEADARRRAERERDDLQRRLDAVMTQPRQQPQPPPQQVDLFDNPSRFVQQEMRPYMEQINAYVEAQFEQMSKVNAVGRFGAEKVDAAYQALALGMQRGDPEVERAYKHIMASPDRYGAIVQWHQRGEIYRAVGGDLEAYNQRVREEALNDPEYRKRVIESMKGQAQASGNNVARPVTVASSPSLGNVGATGGDPQLIEPSDIEYFRAATQAKRR